ncbi:hypothetical protein RND71_000510 [Anisodus tanguticus]|uniref:Phytocyanin domain-containing protein n=1 Tax=Anisodus tanguticus TaxID=243964 RepID=A0AAE1SZQ6_9SOLA|nr:hypothetical protein RND71_000510 [Anisodus tanguticus]
MSGKQVSAIFWVTIMVLFSIQITNASTTYNVGDGNGGWTLGASNWPNGKTFKAGDLLGMKLAVPLLCLFLILIFVINSRRRNFYLLSCESSVVGILLNKWPSGKNFKAGDVLVFKYPKGVHNVVIVNKANYDNCKGSGKIFSSGNDRVTLTKGTTYFVCGIAGHCDGGQKITITAN